MKKTVNQLRTEFQAIQEGHGQLNSFFWGSPLRANMERDIKYPLMATYYTTGGISSNLTALNFTIVIADRVFKDLVNLNDTQSDTLQIVRDVVNIMMQSRRWNRIGRVNSVSLEFFIGKLPDEVSGHTATINFSLFDTASICDLPMFGYDFEGDFSATCSPVMVLDSDGVTWVEIPAGGSFVCTPVAPATVSNSDDSFSITVNSGDDIILPNIEITTGSGVLVRPSVKDVDLSNYFLIVNPTGSRIPNLIPIVSPSTQTAWINYTPNTSPSLGKIMKNNNADQAFDSSGGFLIPTLGDFEVEFKIDTNNSSAGVSFYDSGLGYNDIDFSVYQDNGAYAIFEKMTRKAVGTSTLNSLYKIARQGQTMKYYVDGVAVYGSELISPVNMEGYMVFDTSLFTPGTSITNIKLTFL